MKLKAVLYEGLEQLENFTQLCTAHTQQDTGSHKREPAVKCVTSILFLEAERKTRSHRSL